MDWRFSDVQTGTLAGTNDANYAVLASRAGISGATRSGLCVGQHDCRTMQWHLSSLKGTRLAVIDLSPRRPPALAGTAEHHRHTTPHSRALPPPLPAPLLLPARSSQCSRLRLRARLQVEPRTPRVLRWTQPSTPLFARLRSSAGAPVCLSIACIGLQVLRESRWSSTLSRNLLLLLVSDIACVYRLLAFLIDTPKWHHGRHVHS